MAEVAVMHNMLCGMKPSYIFTQFRTVWFRFQAIQNNNDPYCSCLYCHMDPVVIT